MSNASERKAEEALQEYLAAVDKYNQLLGPARKLVTGEKIVFKEWNKELFKELEEAEAKVTETRRKWDESLRRLCGA